MSLPVSDTSPKQTKPPVKRGIPFGYVVIAIIAVGITVLLVGTASGGRYELAVGEVVTRPEKFTDKNIRIRGQIKDGSIVATTENGRPLTRFSIVDEHGHELPIVSRESPPDNFSSGKSCIVEGKYTESGIVESTRLTMKCPSKYEAEGQTEDTPSGDLYKRYGTPPTEYGPRS
jgi:cytochrome c-type biogenesis protein CcmE